MSWLIPSKPFDLEKARGTRESILTVCLPWKVVTLSHYPSLFISALKNNWMSIFWLFRLIRLHISKPKCIIINFKKHNTKTQQTNHRALSKALPNLYISTGYRDVAVEVCISTVHLHPLMSQLPFAFLASGVSSGHVLSAKGCSFWFSTSGPFCPQVLGCTEMEMHRKAQCCSLWCTSSQLHMHSSLFYYGWFWGQTVSI